MLRKLLDVAEAADQRAQLISAGLAWLPTREDRAEWSFVLRKLLDVAEAQIKGHNSSRLALNSSLSEKGNEVDIRLWEPLKVVAKMSIRSAGDCYAHWKGKKREGTLEDF